MIELAEQTLSIFCDESGDFGAYESHSPYYILSLVLHDQSVDISDQVRRLEERLANNGYERDHAIHTAPLVRRENPYESETPEMRKKMFDSLFTFFRYCDVSVMTVVIEKRKFGSGESLSERIATEVGALIRESLSYFQQYDRVIVYYDQGQREVTRLLKLVFLTNLNNVEFRVVSPDKYKLFQVADLICTLELVDAKRKGAGLSKSESEFFGNAKRLKSNYMKVLESKKM